MDSGNPVSPFQIPLAGWISMWTGKEFSPQKLHETIPDLLLDLKHILSLMRTTNVVQLANDFPALAQFIDLATRRDEYKGNILISRLMTKIIFYMSLGSYGDENRPEVEVKINRKDALQWSLLRLNTLNTDKIQAPFAFLNTKRNLEPGTTTHLSETRMMTDLGFGQTQLSSSIVGTLVSALLLKLNKLADYYDAFVAVQPSLVDESNRTNLFSTSQYITTLLSISRRVTIMMDNGLLMHSLVHRLISMPEPVGATNVLFSSTEISPSQPSSRIPETSSSNESDYCSCGLSNYFIDKLFMGSNYQIFYLTCKSPIRAGLLFKCHRALNKQISGLIRKFVARPCAPKGDMESWLAPMIESALLYPNLWFHFKEVLSSLIFKSSHPALVNLWIHAHQLFIQLFYDIYAPKRPGVAFEFFWPNRLRSLINSLLVAPTIPHFATIVNLIRKIDDDPKVEQNDRMEIDTPPMSSSLLLSSIGKLKEIWINVLAFKFHIDFAYSQLLEPLSCSESERTCLAEFIAFHAHPSNPKSRAEAAQLLLLQSLLILEFFQVFQSGDSITLLVSQIASGEPCVRPLLLKSLYKLTNADYIFHFLLEMISERSLVTTIELLEFMEYLAQRSTSPSPSDLSSLINKLLQALPDINDSDFKSRMEGIASMVSSYSSTVR